MADESGQRVLRRILPSQEGELLSALGAYGEFDFAADATGTRPFVVVNMVMTADGQARIGADTEALGGAVDAQLFAALRESVDCVLAGTRTIEVEGYNAPARSENVQARRLANGLAARPLVATITRSGRLPTSAPLFADAGITVAAFGAEAGAGDPLAADVVASELTDPAEVLRSLREDFDVRSVLLEGGPTINTDFFAAELVDQLFLTIAPVLTGGDPQFPIIGGELTDAQSLHLLGAYTADDHLFLRYRVD